MNAVLVCVLLCWLEEANKECAPRRGGWSQCSKQVGISQGLSITVEVPPRIRIVVSSVASRRIVRILSRGGASDEFSDDTPPCLDSCSGSTSR